MKTLPKWMKSRWQMILPTGDPWIWFVTHWTLATKHFCAPMNNLCGLDIPWWCLGTAAGKQNKSLDHVVTSFFGFFLAISDFTFRMFLSPSCVLVHSSIPPGVSLVFTPRCVSPLSWLPPAHCPVRLTDGEWLLSQNPSLSPCFPH